VVVAHWEPLWNVALMVGSLNSTLDYCTLTSQGNGSC
jgi:hypothetical protein